jgi:hypothetical protein
MQPEERDAAHLLLARQPAVQGLQRRQRQEIVIAEVEIMGKRDQFIDQLENRLPLRTATEKLFTICWAVA